MKLKILSFVLLVFILASCEDFLDRKPLGQMTQEDFDKLAQSGTGNDALVKEFDKLLLGAYLVFSFDENEIDQGKPTHHGEWMWDMLTDDAEKGGENAGDYSQITRYREWITQTGLTGPHTAAYLTGYSGVTRANDVLRQLMTKVDAIGDTLQVNRIMGEALFIRAWYYFYLTKIFGSVQYFDFLPTEEGAKIPQPLPAEMYKLIEADLYKAIAMLPTKNQMKLNFGISPSNRANKAVAQMLLARVISMEIGFGYNNKSWQEVYDLTKSIINSNVYGLVNNYAQVFAIEGEMGIESVFEIDAYDYNQQLGGPKTNIQVLMCSPRLGVSPQNAGKNIVSGWGFQLPTKSLFEAFEPGDPRLKNTIIASGDILLEDGLPTTDEMIIIDEGSAMCPTGYFNRKAYVGMPIPSCNSCSELNKRLIRYSEVLLLAAEAAYHLGFEAEARDYVNIIRDRARNSSAPKGSQLGNPDYPARNNDPSVLPPVIASGEELLKAIKHERRVELALEGHRLWDLYRWGDYENAIKTYTELDNTITIPTNEVISNWKSHMFDGKVPVLPIHNTEVKNYGVNPSPGYVY